MLGALVSYSRIWMRLQGAISPGRTAKSGPSFGEKLLPPQHRCTSKLRQPSDDARQLSMHRVCDTTQVNAGFHGVTLFGDHTGLRQNSAPSPSPCTGITVLSMSEFV